MKKSLRAVVGVLVVALLVSCIAFSAMATTKEYTVENYAEILEYYEEPVIFSLDFESLEEGAYTENIHNAVPASQLTAIASDADGKYLKLPFGSTARKVGNMFLNWNAPAGAIDDFFFNFTVSGTGVVKVYVNNEIQEGTSSADLGGTELVSVDFKNGAVSYYGIKETDPETGAVTMGQVDLGFAVSADVKYKVEMIYKPSYNSYSLKITNVADEEDYAEVTKVPADIKDTLNVRIGCHKASAPTGSVINIHDIDAYGGSFIRDTEKKQPETEAAILKMAELFADEQVSVEEKLKIATVASKLVLTYGVTSEEEDVVAAANSLVTGGITIFAEQLDACLAAAVDTATYDERVANVEKYKLYVTLIPENFEELVDENTAEAVSATLVAFDNEVEALANYKINSDAFIAGLEGLDAESTDYAHLSSYYDAVAEYYPSVYGNYEGIADALAAFRIVSNKINVFRENVAAFVANSLIAADTDNGFGERYAAYVVAKENLLTEESFPGVSTFFAEDGTTYDEAFEAFGGVYAGISEVIEDKNGDEKTYEGIEALIALCSAYIDNVNSASAALYVKAQVGFLAIADELGVRLEALIPDYDEFPGFVEAQELENEILKQVEDKTAAAQAYVDAVAALEGLEGDALLAAIEEVKVLQAEGDILGIDGVDVAGANIIFSNITAVIELELGYKNQFIAIVESLSEVQTLEEYYNVLTEAKAAEASTTDEYADVAVAMETLAQQIEYYNAMVDAINGGFDAMVAFAAELSATVDNEMAAKVVELIETLI